LGGSWIFAEGKKTDGEIISPYAVTRGRFSDRDVSPVQKSTRRKSLPLEEKVSALADG